MKKGSQTSLNNYQRGVCNPLNSPLRSSSGRNKDRGERETQVTKTLATDAVLGKGMVLGEEMTEVRDTGLS